MVFRTIATSAALLVGLAVAGAVAGPQWHPQPVTEHVVPATQDTTIGGVDPAAVAAGEIGEVGDHEVLAEPVTIQLEGATIGGLLRRPLEADGSLMTGRPGVVFVHGAGTGKAVEAFARTAADLASAGVVTLVPDKRLDTYSLRERDYEAMALDYDRSVDLLRTVDGVDPARVGLYGESEGTWIVPVLQADDPTIAFTILTSAPVVPPREQAAFAADSYLRHTGVPDQVFRAIPRAVGMQFPGGGFTYADFDVRPWLAAQTAPVLVVYGTADASMPIEQGARIILTETGAVPGEAPVTVRYYAGADHGIRVREGTPEGATAPLHPDFVPDLAAWVQGQPGTADAAPQVAGATPEQLFRAVPVPQPRWWGNGDVVVAAVLGGTGLVLLALVAWGVVALVVPLVRRRRDGPAPPFAPGVGPALVALGAGAVATTGALAVYLLLVARLAFDYQRNDVIVQGGWVTVRLLGVLTAVAAAVLLQRVADVRSARRAGGDVVVARGVPAGIVLWCVVAGSVSLLLTLAYWGVYQLGI
ncbi:alpha/beta hydrolase [Isoptericola sp. S6320L]|uniref:alpha/beta hydrolase family protein n=1 Tax=Isoptericola sp. S6320L TaxID=2926411 RepID=UPI001FF69645|nr:alpha/beta hydrolase [Isoptericola sp. S6320L]MCK0117483.1 alpha/beta hydrolase [Isoptericola sp. S6320L]